MLLEIGLADSYGIAFEFIPLKDDTRPNTGRDFYTNPKYDTLKAGHYTDDTQRSLANALVVLEGDPFSIRSYAESYYNIFQRDPRDGYSRRYQSFLEGLKAPEEFMKQVRTTAISNGSLMGVLPTGYLPSPGEVRAAASAQAMVTHSYETVPYAQSLALAAHHGIYQYEEEQGIDLWTFLKKEVHWAQEFAYSHYRSPTATTVSMKAHETWQAVLELVRRYSDLNSILRAAIDMRGDTDSVAALAVGLASTAPNNYVSNLSLNLLNDFENGPHGRQYLIEIDNRLREKFL